LSEIGFNKMVEKNICKNCGEPLLYAIELNRSKLWGLCKKCFSEGIIPNPPYNKYLIKKSQHSDN